MKEGDIGGKSAGVKELRLVREGVLQAPPEKVFAAYADFESRPKWSPSTMSVRVVKREGSTVWYEVEGTVRGYTEKFTSRQTLAPPSRIEVETETRFSVTRVQVTLEGVPEGTKVTSSYDIVMKGLFPKLVGPFTKGRLQRGLAEEATSFKEYLESL